MRISQNGLNLIREFEGLRLSCYHLGDGVCTIGIGTTRPLFQCRGAGTWTITEAQAYEFLATNVQVYENAVRNYFTRSLNQNQFDALVSFSYNLGVHVFANDKWDRNASDNYITSSLINYVNKGSQWEQGLRRRREAEIKLFNAPIANNLTINWEEKFMKMLITNDTGRTYLLTAENCRWIKAPANVEAIDRLYAGIGKNLPRDRVLQIEVDRLINGFNK